MQRLVHRNAYISLLLAATARSVFLALARNDLAEHHHAVAIHESDAGEALAVLEGVAHQGLLWLEAALRHLVRLQRVRVLHLLAAGLLAHLPLELGDAASRAAATHEADRRVSYFDLVGDIKDLDLGVELLRLPEGGVLLVHHHVPGTRHVLLVQALDVEADIVAWVRIVHALVVHLDREHLACARIRSSVRGQENHLLTGLHHALLDAASEHIAHALDLIYSGDGHPHRGARGTLGHAAHLVENVVQGLHVDRLLAHFDIHALPPAHVVRLLQQVVAHPAGDWQHGSVLLNNLLLPSDLHKHA